MEKMSLEVAEKEFNAWLDHKNVKESKREAYKDAGESIIQCLCEGSVTIDGNMNLTYKPTPVMYDDKEDGNALSELVFKPRLRQFEVNKYMKGVKADDAEGRLLAFTCASTGVNKGLIQKLYTEEFQITQNIALYFL